MAKNEMIRLPASAGTELGKSGTYLYYGYISGEEYNNNVRGKLGLENFDIMRRSDATVHAILQVCKLPIVAAEWDIEPASDDPDDVERRDFAYRELFNRNIIFSDIVREALTCLDFGHSAFEEVWSKTDFNGKFRIGLDKLASRKQRSIMRWSTASDEPGITQILPTGGLIDIPMDKLAVFVNEKEGDNWEGISLLRFAYKHWKIKESLELMQAIALERMSLGIPVMEKGLNGTTQNETELQKVRDSLRNIRVNEESYLEKPAGVGIEMLDMKANSTKDILPTLLYEDRQIMLSVLAQFLGLGTSDGSGARALSEDHSRLFVRSLEAVARVIQQTFQKQIINRLIDLNYSDLPNGYPHLVFNGLSDDNVAELADAVNKLMTVGALTADPDMENRLRKALKIPELPDDMYENYGGKQDQSTTTNPETTPISKDANNDLPDSEQAKAKKKEDALKAARSAQEKLMAAIAGV